MAVGKVEVMELVSIEVKLDSGVAETLYIRPEHIRYILGNTIAFAFRPDGPHEKMRLAESPVRLINRLNKGGVKLI